MDADQVRAMLKNARPDGIICANDKTAAELMQTLHRLKIQVPRDINVVGIDDVRYAKLLQPTLTTIHQPCQQMERSRCRRCSRESPIPLYPRGRLCCLCISSPVNPLSFVIRTDHAPPGGQSHFAISDCSCDACVAIFRRKTKRQRRRRSYGVPNAIALAPPGAESKNLPAKPDNSTF